MMTRRPRPTARVLASLCFLVGTSMLLISGEPHATEPRVLLIMLGGWNLWISISLFFNEE